MWAYPEMVKMLFSPRVISVTPSSQPSLYQPMATSSGVYYKSQAPLMTLPTPICVLKSPRPTDESNLDVARHRSAKYLLRPVCVQRNALCTYCLPLKSFSGPTLESYRLPVYSMVTSSPFLGLSVPLPCLIIFRLTPIVLVELA